MPKLTKKNINVHDLHIAVKALHINLFVFIFYACTNNAKCLEVHFFKSTNMRQHPTGMVSCSKYDHKNKFCLYISYHKQGRNVCIQFWKFPESIFTAAMKLGQSNIFSSVCQ